MCVSNYVVQNAFTMKEPKEKNLIADFHQLRADIRDSFVELRHCKKETQYADYSTKSDGNIKLHLDSQKSCIIDLSGMGNKLSVK